MLHRKAEPEIIARKASASGATAKSGASSAAATALTGAASGLASNAAQIASRSTAVAQIHRSLKAWRSEDEKAAEPTDAGAAKAGDDKGSEEKLDEPAGKAAGGAEGSGAGKAAAMDDGGKEAGAAEGAATEGSAAAAPGAEGASESSEVKEEAPSVGAKLKVLAKPKSAEDKKKKEEEIAKKKELLTKKVELASAQGDQTTKLKDLAAGIGIEALAAAALLVPPPAGPAIAAAIKGLGAVASPVITIALDAQREVQADVLTKAISTMGAASVKKLANKWANVEPKIQSMEADIAFHVKLIKDAGVGGTGKDKAAAGAKGVAGEAVKQGIEKGAEAAAETAVGSFMAKWVPFVGTAIKLAEIAKVTSEISTLREEIEKIEAELA